MTRASSMAGSLPYDVVCAGPLTLDVTLAGLERLPDPGEERFGTELAFSPGAFATIAVAAARLGLRAAVLAPVPTDPAGDVVRGVLEREGVDWLGESTDRTAVTLVIPLAGDRALASYDPGAAGPAPLETVEGGAYVIGAGDLPSVPSGARAYVAIGADPRGGIGMPDSLEGADVLFANEAEATQLTGQGDASAAVRGLASSVPVAIVTCGSRGALACDGEVVVTAEAPAVDAVDTTGAGDVFAATFVWAYQAGLPLADTLRWATQAASLSVRALGTVAGAPTRGELLCAGRSAGLVPPP